ncbi:MAG: hypothetical protein WA432_02080 [Candidatus Babeliaceae bacterium]
MGRKKNILKMFIFSIIFSSRAEQNEQQTAQPEVWITVIVHGTIGLRPYLAPRTIIKLFKDDIACSAYEKGVWYIRHNPFFYKNQPITAPGLVPLSITTPIKENGAQLYASLFDSLFDTPNNDTRFYYAFGWSGLVSCKKRLEAARTLFKELNIVLRAFKEQHINPHIRLIGYSHGGNVLLNLAQVQPNKDEEQLSIDELICIGMPVQKETDFLINSPLFKKIYHFYSREDHIQKLDCFSTKRFFSCRRFKNNKRFMVPENLVQAEIKIKVHSQKYRRKHCIDRSPGHVELWCFGWPTARMGYRSYFPLYPLPVAVFIRELVNMIDKSETKEKHLVIELFPEDACAYIRKRYDAVRTEVPFITQEKLNNMCQEAVASKPDFYTMKTYMEQVHNAINMAQPRKKKYTSRRKKCMCGS